MIKLPEEAFFKDYAGIAFNDGGHGKRAAIVSQEDAAVWVGNFNWDTLEFEGEGEVRGHDLVLHCTIASSVKWHGTHSSSYQMSCKMLISLSPRHAVSFVEWVVPHCHRISNTALYVY